MIDYATEKHAEAVYWSCVRAGKIKLALAIKKKYNLQIHSDLVMSFGMSLLSLKNLKENEKSNNE